MGLFKLKKGSQGNSAESGNVDDWLKTIDEDAENAAISTKEASGLAPIAGVDTHVGTAPMPPAPSSGPTSISPLAPTASDQQPESPVAEVVTPPEADGSGWHLPNVGADSAVAADTLDSAALPDLGFSKQPPMVSPQEQLPPAWAAAPEPPFEADATHSTPFEADATHSTPFEADATHSTPFEAVRPVAAPPLETAPPLEPGPEIESISDGIIPRNIDLDLESDLAVDYGLDDLGVVLDAPEEGQAHPFEPTGLAGRSRGRITESTGTIRVPEGDSVATLLAILGLDRDVSWDEVKQSHSALIADHLAAGESDPERAELARSIRREINSAYIALRLLQVP